MSDLSILFLGHPQTRQSGDWLHRVAWPGQALGERARVTTLQTLHPAWVREALAADVLVVLMIAEPILEEVMKQRRMAGRATVYEISDDFCAVAPSNPLVGFYARPEVQVVVKQLARMADAVEFSSDFLAAKYAGLNELRATFRNQLASVEPLSPCKTGNRSLTVGWAGSLGHLEDARLLAGWIAHWPRHRDVCWKLMCAQEVARVFLSAGIQAELRPTGNMEAYLGFLDELDVGLAWVGDDDFSRGRSDGKFLEYASRGVLPVCRNSPVYARTLADGQTGYMFGDEAQLHGILDVCLNNPSQVRQIARQAYDHVFLQRTHPANAAGRLDFYAGLTRLRTADSRGFEEMQSPLEADLYAGLEMVNKGQKVEALNQMLGVMEREPEFYFVWQVLETVCLQLGKTDEAHQCARRKAALLYQDLPF